jgi:hypothetical protein
MYPAVRLLEMNSIMLEEDSSSSDFVRGILPNSNYSS